MSTRRIVVGAVFLAALLLVSAFSTQAAGGLSRWAITPVWSIAVPSVQMVAEIRGRTSGPAQIIAQGQEKVVVVDAAGALLATRDFPGGPLNTAMGDLNGDGAEDLIVAQGAAASVTTFDGALKPLWPAPVATGLTQATRVLGVDLDGDGRREVVVGDAQGGVAALSPAGRLLWSHAFPAARENAEVRGLDDLTAANGVARLVAVARRSGELALLDARGKVVASLQLGSPVRRLRVLDLDGDGLDEAVVGDEAGYYHTVAGDGARAIIGGIGETITEIRTLEVDGNAARREWVVGGKRGNFVLLSMRGMKLARGSVTGKVSAAGGVDCDGDGRDELFLGTEEGGLFMFDGHGKPLAEMGSLGKVERILGVESALRDRLVVVGAGSTLQGFRAKRARAPAWYAPWAPAGIGLLAIMAGALALALTQPPPAPVAAPVADARAKEDDLSIARVNDLMARGVVTPEMGARRLQQLERRRAKRKG